MDILLIRGIQAKKSSDGHPTHKFYFQTQINSLHPAIEPEAVKIKQLIINSGKQKIM